MNAQWETGVFPEGDYGSIWQCWGIAHRAGRRYLVFHIPTGTRLTEFTGSLRAARRFCEAIDPLVDDWSTALTATPFDARLDLIMHREACRAAGLQAPVPNLRVAS